MFTDFIRPGKITSALALLIYNEDQIAERLAKGLKPSDIHREINEWLQNGGSDFEFSYETMRRFVASRNLRSKSSREPSPLQGLKNKAGKKNSTNELPSDPSQKSKTFDPTGYVDENELI